jgi:hypothetical protein
VAPRRYKAVSGTLGTRVPFKTIDLSAYWHGVERSEMVALGAIWVQFWAFRSRLFAEDQLPAIRAGRGGKFMIAKTAIVKFAERIR